MKKFYSIVAALCFGVAAFAQNHSVTFQVDLGSSAANSNGVHVAGSFQSWSPSTTSMSQVGSTSVYSVTVSVPAGQLEYKFVNGNQWGDDESVPSSVNIGTNGNGNRWAVISQDTTLPAVMFGGAAPAGQKAIQFKVDYALQTLSADSAHVAGNFQGWDPAKSQMVNFDGVHRYIAYVNKADSVYFKFLNGNDWSTVEAVDSTCQASSAGIGQGDNRYYTDTVSGIYEVCYSQCGPCTVLPTYDITVNVDVSAIAACGTVDSVSLAGPINGWGGETMSDPDGDGVWSITYYDVDSGDFTFKARYHENGNTNWEGGGNKVITVSSDSIIETRCFGNDNYGSCPSVPSSADLTFEVDFNQSGYTPANTVYLLGNFNSWNPVAMNPSAISGRYTYTLSQYCHSTVEYRFMNGTTLENIPASCGIGNGVGAYNRYHIRNGNNETLSHVFGSCISISSRTDNHNVSLQACTGDLINYEFDITSAFDSTNTFRVEISNSGTTTFSGNYIEVNPLTAYQVDTNYQIALKIPDTLSQQVYSVRLISTSPALTDGVINNIIIGESPKPILSYTSNGIINPIGNKDTIRACASDSVIIIAQSVQNSGSWSPYWQWYKNGSPIAGATNDSVFLIGFNDQGEYYLEEGSNLCDGESDSIHFAIETYTGSVTTSSQFYNPPNTITAIATGGTSYQWSADKPIFIDDVTNDTVEVALMSDSTILDVDVSYGLNCIQTHTILLMDTSTIVCDVYDTTLVIINDTNHINIYDTSYVNVYDTTYIAVYDTNVVDVFDTTYVTVYDTNYIDIFDTTYINVYDTVLVTQIDTVYLTVTDTLIIDVSFIGINPPTFEYQLRVYPNPTKSHLYVEVPQNMIGQSYSMEVRNSIGQSMFGVGLNQPLVQINFNSFGAAGSYTLLLKNPQGAVIDTRIIMLQ